MGFLVSKNAHPIEDKRCSQNRWRIIQEQCHLKGKITIHWSQQKRRPKKSNLRFLFFFLQVFKVYGLSSFEAIYKVFKICILVMMSLHLYTLVIRSFMESWNVNTQQFSEDLAVRILHTDSLQATSRAQALFYFAFWLKHYLFFILTWNLSPTIINQESLPLNLFF